MGVQMTARIAEGLVVVVEMRAVGPVAVGRWEARGREVWGGILPDHRGGARRQVLQCEREVATQLCERSPLEPVEVEVQDALVVGLRPPVAAPTPMPWAELKAPRRVVPMLVLVLVLLAFMGCESLDASVECRCEPGFACTTTGECLQEVEGDDGRAHLSRRGATLCGAEVVGPAEGDEAPCPVCHGGQR